MRPIVSSGRAAVNVLKERMQPGDSVEIVTPNATAAIRGTIVVAEVESDDAGTRSTITVLRGLIDVTQHDASGRAFGRPVSVSALQQVTASGPRLSPVRPITRQAADRLANDFTMGLRAAPVMAPPVTQAEVDRAVLQVARETGGKNTGDRTADSKGNDDKDSKASDSGNGGDSAKGGDANISTGYHAIEFLLWGQDTSATGPGDRPYTDYVDGGTAQHQDRRRAYLSAVSSLLVENRAMLALFARLGQMEIRHDEGSTAHINVTFATDRVGELRAALRERADQ